MSITAEDQQSRRKKINLPKIKNTDTKPYTKRYRPIHKERGSSIGRPIGTESNKRLLHNTEATNFSKDSRDHRIDTMIHDIKSFIAMMAVTWGSVSCKDGN